jgi:thymidylate kinase
LNVAFEGPCCSGKTTLGRGIEKDLGPRRVLFIKDYYDYTRQGAFFPPSVPVSLGEEERALDWLLTVERNRTARARAAWGELEVVLIDRSIHTLLAHCYALTRISALDYFSKAEAVIEGSAAPLWPDMIFYLDLSHQHVCARNKGKFADDSVFVDADFNAGIEAYFDRLARGPAPRVVSLDARVGAASLRIVALSHLADALSRWDGRERPQ